VFTAWSQYLTCKVKHRALPWQSKYGVGVGGGGGGGGGAEVEVAAHDLDVTQAVCSPGPSAHCVIVTVEMQLLGNAVVVKVGSGGDIMAEDTAGVVGTAHCSVLEHVILPDIVVHCVAVVVIQSPPPT
jgi:hypothetical protein